MLNPSDAQAGKAGPLNGSLPGREFFKRELVAIASLVDREETAVHCGDDLRLSAHDPAARGRRWKRLQGKRLSKRANDLRWAKLVIFDHSTSSGDAHQRERLHHGLGVFVFR